MRGGEFSMPTGGQFCTPVDTNAQIRAKAPKLLAFKTYGKLAEHIRKAFAAGQTKAQVAEGLGVTAARVNELAVCLQIEQPKARGTGDICVDRPTIGPDGEFRMEAPREPKAKAKA